RRAWCAPASTSSSPPLRSWTARVRRPRAAKGRARLLSASLTAPGSPSACAAEAWHPDRRLHLRGGLLRIGRPLAEKRLDGRPGLLAALRLPRREVPPLGYFAETPRAAHDRSTASRP